MKTRDIAVSLLIQIVGLFAYSPLWVVLAAVAAWSGHVVPLAVCVAIASLVPLAVLSAYIEAKPRPGSWQSGPGVIRGTLPDWAWWLETPDEPLPGGMYEPTVRKWYETYGWHVCAVLWLWRNRAAAFGVRIFGEPLSGPEVLDEHWRTIGPLKFGCGYKAVPTEPPMGGEFPQPPYVKLPFVTVRFAKDAA